MAPSRQWHRNQRHPRTRPTVTPQPRRGGDGAGMDPTPARVPQLGETVHFVAYPSAGGEYGKECRAAVVTRVRGASGLSLAVYHAASVEFVQYVNSQQLGPDADPRAEHRSGTWHWPGDQHSPGEL